MRTMALAAAVAALTGCQTLGNPRYASTYRLCQAVPSEAVRHELDARGVSATDCMQAEMHAAEQRQRAGAAMMRAGAALRQQGAFTPVPRR